MATLFARTGSTFSGTTWALCDAGASATSLTIATSSGFQTVSFPTASSTSTFTITNAAVVEGVLLRMGAFGTGTFVVALNDGTTDVRSVTCDVSAVSQNQSLINGQYSYHYFKFGTTYTSTGLATMSIKITPGTGNGQFISTSGTATDWNRAIVTTANQAPAASDTLIIAATYTGLGAPTTTMSITMDNTTTTTAYGKLFIGKSCSLNYPTTASTTSAIRLAGVDIGGGATLTMGTSAAAIPSTSTAELLLTAPLDIIDGGRFIARGATKTLFANLTANSAVAAISSSINAIPTGWGSADQIVFAPTDSVSGSFDLVGLTANVSTTTISHGALTNAHSGTSPTQAELLNLTMNVKIHGLNTSSDVQIRSRGYGTGSGGIIDAKFAEIYFMRTGLGLSSIILNPSTASVLGGAYCTFDSCTIHDFTSLTGFGSSCMTMGTFTQVTNITVTNCGLYNFNNSGISIGYSPSTTMICTNNRIFKANEEGIYTITTLPVCTGNTIVGCNPGMRLQIASTSATVPITGNFDGNTLHNNHSGGFLYEYQSAVTSPSNCRFSGLTAWRNTGGGIILDGFLSTDPKGWSFNNCTMFSNTYGMFIYSLTSARISGCNFNGVLGGAAVQQNAGLFIETSCHDLDIINSNFGTSSTHLSGDIQFDTSLNVTTLVRTNAKVNGFCLINTTLNSANEIFNQPVRMTKNFPIISLNHNNVANSNKMYTIFGNVQTDTTFSRSATPGTRLTPISSTNKLECEVAHANAAAGTSVTFIVYVRKSVIGDGATYNGNEARLIVKRNIPAGILSDTVLATTSASHNGAFVILSGTTSAVNIDCTLTAVVDCDGTAGWITVDDAGAT